MAAPKQTLYDILGVSRDASAIDIGLAYKKGAAAADRAIPPDPTRQALVRQAHEILSDDPRRRAYDASLITAAEKQAARAQAAPDLDLAAEEAGQPSGRKLPWLPIAAALLVVVIGALFTLRQRPPQTHAPEVAARPSASAPAAEAPQPMTAAQILAMAVPSAGRVMTYDMSGRMTMAGLAFAVEPSAMVTTCEGMSAGSQVAVKIGPETLSATLAMMDELLGLCRLLVVGGAFKPLTLAPEDPSVGQAVQVLGTNEKGDVSLTPATISQVRAAPMSSTLVLSMPIAAAVTGGAVLDNFGRVVGIATRSDVADTSTALPASAIGSLRSRSRG